MNRFIYKIVTVLAVLLLPNMVSAQPKHEIRAVWLTTLGGLDWPTTKAGTPDRMERQKQELTDILDSLEAAGFNTVLYQARVKGDVAYRSRLEVFTESFTGHEGKDPGYDPLAFAVQECHKRGLEIHAWVITIPVGNDKQIRRIGSQSVVKKNPKICKKYHNVWYLDPGNPETDDYLAAIVKEIVSGYDIDGVHFDYIRYPEHSPKFPDKDTYKKYGNGKEWQQWRRDNITRIVTRLYNETKALKPWVKVSSSPVGKYKDTPRYSSNGWNAFEIVYQDVRDWLKLGIQDAVFPMMYFQDNNFYPFALDWKENSSGRLVAPGLGVYFLHPEHGKWKIDEVVRQLYFLRDIESDGQALFRNRFLMDNIQGLKDEIKQRFYTSPAVWQPITWQDSIPPTVPTEPNIEIGAGGETTIWWTESEDNSEPRQVFYRVYGSNTYPVDTENAENLIKTRVDDRIFTYSPTSSLKQKAYWAVTAVDRYGNESLPLEINAPVTKSIQVLTSLPEPPEKWAIVISDITGNEILRSKSAEGIMESLPNGFYRVSFEDSAGNTEAAGVIVK